MDWGIDSSALDVWVRKNQNRGNIDKALKWYQDRLLDLYLKYARQFANKGKTGRFRDAQRGRWSGDRGYIFVDLNIAPHGKYVIHGTRPHMIYPTIMKHALYWEGAPEGHPWKHVHHPGTKPSPYAHKAVLRAAPEKYRLNQEFIDMVVKL